MYRFSKFLSGFVIILLSILFFVSCDSNRVYEKNISIPDASWNVGFKPSFEFEIQDTSIFYNFYINIRNNTDYPYSNLYLFVDSYLADGSSARDTIEVILATKEGRWLGKGIGKIKESRFFLRNNLVFPNKGRYQIDIEQAMREDALKGIEDIGIRIEKSEM
jgi:gliding motility-associated lipoprotein GldH